MILNDTGIMDKLYEHRLVHEYYYSKNTKLAAEVLCSDFSDKKILLGVDSEHTREIIDNMSDTSNVVGILQTGAGESFDQPLINFDELNKTDFDMLVLTGYWNSANVKALARESGIAEEKICQIYEHSVLQSFVDDVKEKIDSIELSTEKPNLVLILYHDSRDFITKSAKKLCEHFNLVKILMEDKFTFEDEQYFDSVVTFKGSVKLLEYFFEKHSPEMVVVFKHGVDAWKVPYLKEIFSNEPKLVQATSDWLFMIYGDIPDANKALGFSAERGELEDWCENYVLDSCDGMIINFSGYFEKEILQKRAKSYFSSIYLMEESLFRFQQNEPDYDSLNVCYAGSLCYNKEQVLTRLCTVDSVFERLLKQGINVDSYSYYSFNDHKLEMYRELMARYDNFQLKKFLPHQKLVEETKGYDFGLLLYEFSEGVYDIYEKHMLSIIQGKLISYLGAGLPVLVSEEYTFMREMIVENGLGISFTYDEIDNVLPRLKDVDYQALKNNVKKFQQEYMEADHSGQITNYLKNLL